MVRAGPLEDLAHRPQLPWTAMKDPVKRALDDVWRDRGQVKERAGTARERDHPDVSLIAWVETAGPANGYAGEARSVTLRDHHLDRGPLELSEPPEVGRAPMRGDTARRQTG